MAISAVFETTKERLENIFKKKMLNSMVDTTAYFRGMYPCSQMGMQRPDIVSGCIKFLADTFDMKSIRTGNFRIDVAGNVCSIWCLTGAYSFPKIIISNFRSQYMTSVFDKTMLYDKERYPDSSIYNCAIIGLAEALSYYYSEVYNGRREMKV